MAIRRAHKVAAIKVDTQPTHASAAAHSVDVPADGAAAGQLVHACRREVRLHDTTEDLSNTPLLSLLSSLLPCVCD